MAFLTVACCGGLAPQAHPAPHCWMKGAEATQGVFVRSGVTGERDGCKQKNFGSLLEDIGQLKLNHHPKGAHQFLLGLLVPKVPSGTADVCSHCCHSNNSPSSSSLTS